MSRTYGVNRPVYVAAGHVSSCNDVLGKSFLEVAREDRRRRLTPRCVNKKDNKLTRGFLRCLVGFGGAGLILELSRLGEKLPKNTVELDLEIKKIL